MTSLSVSILAQMFVFLGGGGGLGWGLVSVLFLIVYFLA